MLHHTSSNTGQGKLTLGDNGYYEGSFVNGEIEGHGFRLFGLTGSSYTGWYQTLLQWVGVVRCVCSLQVSSTRERCTVTVYCSIVMDPATRENGPTTNKRVSECCHSVINILSPTRTGHSSWS